MLVKAFGELCKVARMMTSAVVGLEQEFGAGDTWEGGTHFYSVIFFFFPSEVFIGQEKVS